MRFKHWIRDRNKVLGGMTEDPLVNLLVKMLRKLGIKARGFDVEDYIKNRSGMLSSCNLSIMVDDNNTLSINTNVGDAEEKLDSNIHKLSPYWHILVSKED